MPVEHAVQATGFVLVPRDAVVYLLGGVAEEVVRLPLHGAESGVQEEKPAVDLVAFARAGRVADFVVHAVVLFDEVLHNRPGFEQPDRLTVGKRVGEGGDAAVGVDGEEKGFLLSVLGYVNFMGLVREARTRGGKKGASVAFSSSKLLFAIRRKGPYGAQRETRGGGEGKQTQVLRE